MMLSRRNRLGMQRSLLLNPYLCKRSWPYMSGAGVQIFSIGIVFMLLLSPFKNIVGINEGAFLNPFVIWKLVSFSQAFAQLHLRQEKSPKSILTLPLQKFVFLLCNILTLGVGLWKCRSMGLLPTGTGD